MDRRPLYTERSPHGAHADAVLSYIKDYMLQHGTAPRLRDIANAFSASSYWASTQLRELQKQGKIRKRAHIARGIELL